MTAAEIAERLGDGAASGCESRGWMVRCPAHDDRSPSLRIGVGDDGRVLVYCFAGCATEDVLRCAGLTFADLHAESLGPLRAARTTQRPAKHASRPKRAPREADADRILLGLRVHGCCYRATANPRMWIGRCPCCDDDGLYVLEAGVDRIIDDALPVPARVGCFQGCDPAAIRQRIGSPGASREATR
jgi:hypothetical protein